MSGRHALGIHIGHDRSAAIVSDGELVAHIAEERLERCKHSNSPELPLRSVAAVLDIAGLGTKDIGVVGVCYTAVEISKIAGLLGDEIREALHRPELDVVGTDHHDCHAWSTYCTADT